MKPGFVLAPTYSAGSPDFPGAGDDYNGQTMSQDGATLAKCWKCESCGRSVT